MATSKPAPKKVVEPITKHGIKYSAIQVGGKFKYKLPTGQEFKGTITHIDRTDDKPDGKPQWVRLIHKDDGDRKVRPGALTARY